VRRGVRSVAEVLTIIGAFASAANVAAQPSVAGSGDAKTLQGGVLLQTPLLGGDGKDYAITGDPDANMRSYKKMNDRTLSMTAKKGGEVVLYSLITVSADGKSQDVNLASSAAAASVYKEKKDKGFRNKAVYDKE